MIIIMVSGKTQPESFYVILRRSGTKKNKGDISPNSREISPKRKKSIDLETVVIKLIVHKICGTDRDLSIVRQRRLMKAFAAIKFKRKWMMPLCFPNHLASK